MKILLRVPNLSFVLQGEDTVNFKELKEEWRVQKTRLFTELNKDRQTHRVGHRALKWEHFMPCFKPAWDNGFTVERHIKGWRLEGLIPFNRNALWRKHASNAMPLSLLRASTGHIAIPAINSSSPAANPLDPEGAAEDPSPAAAPSFHLTAPVAEAVTFVTEDKLPTSEGPISFEELLASYIRLQESSKTMANFLKYSVEKPKEPEKQRMTARTIHGKRGSATGPQIRQWQGPSMMKPRLRKRRRLRGMMRGSRRKHWMSPPM
jgi:hypothetical protein